MEPSHQWREGVIYSVFIYGGHYIVVVSWFTRFDDVVTAVREHCVDEYKVKEPLNLVILSAMYLDETHARMLEDEELVTLVVGK